MPRDTITVQAISVWLLLACSMLPLAAAPKEGDTQRAMHVLQANCLSCHNAEKQKAGIDLSTREAALKGGDPGQVLAPGQPEKSPLFSALSPDADPHMPPRKQLSTNDIAVLRRWIKSGAAWDHQALARAAAPRSVRLQSMPVAFQPVLALAVSPDGKQIAIGRGSSIVVHDLSATNFAVRVETNAGLDAVRSLAWSPDGRFLASGSFREITVRDAATLAPIWSVTSNLLDRITAMQFTSTGETLIVSDGVTAQSGWIRLFKSDTGAATASWQAHSDAISAIVLSADAKYLATASADKLAKVWELESRKELAALEHSAAAHGIAFNSNATEVVTVCADKQFKIWDIKTRESVVTEQGKKAFTALAWSPDGKLAIAGDESGALISYSEFKRHTGAQSSDTARDKVLGRFPDALHSVALSTDNKLIFAGAHDGTVYVMNKDGKELAKLRDAENNPVDTHARSAKQPQAPSFVRDVLPALAKAGCMAGSCHAKAEGQNGFKLSVFSYDPRGDYAEVVKDGRGRRIFPAAPGESLLLLKPTAAVEHGGGERIEPGSDTYRLLVNWIRGGMVYQHTNEPALTGVVVAPAERTYRKGASEQLRVTARFSDGSTRDVTRLADFAANDKELAQVTEDGRVRVGSIAGETVVVARYMGFVDAARITIPAERKLPEKRYSKLPTNNFIDRLAYSRFRELGLFPSEPCTDAEFMRRSSLDTIGMLPTPEEARTFSADTNANKRERWVERLLAHPSYADYWANKWADLLRPNPDRVGVKSIFVLDQWLREQFRKDVPYDAFVRAILLAEGSNHREGPAVVYRDRREPPEITTMFSQLFLGTRMECAKCHHHPNEKWSQDDFYQFAAFFGPVKQKGVGLSPPISGGVETFYFGGAGAVKHPVTGELMKPRPPDGSTPLVLTNTDPRQALADWLMEPENPFFARAAVNRVWAGFFGRGFVHPVDDFRTSNPPANEPLLNALAADFAANGYSLKHLMRTILASHLYQLSSMPSEFNLADTRNFSRAYRRRLPAEVLLDAVADVTGVRDDFNGCPPGTRAIQTWSYKVRSQFLDAFGRPNSSSDCPCERDERTSVVQSLHMMNSRGLQTKLSSAEGRVKKLADSTLTPAEVVTELYLTAFSRFPNANELKTAAAAYTTEGTTRQTATEDVLWALLNSPEFQFNH